MALISIIERPKVETPPLPQFQQNDILYIHDVFEPLNFEEFFKTSGTPDYIINDQYVYLDWLPGKFYSTPLWLEDQLKKFEPETIVDPDTIYAFNFMINKKQTHRYLCLKLVELFNFNNYDYTWSGIGAECDMSLVINDVKALGDASPISEQELWQLLSPVKLSTKFQYFNHSTTDDDVGVVTIGGYDWLWKNAHKERFYSSAVSVITETPRLEHGAAFTEKTVYSVLGLTFPIWVGGYANADSFKLLGFDVFDDIIDHSYQYYPTLIERCYYAFKKNLSILNDVKIGAKFRKDNMSRLINNRNILFTDQIKNFNKKRIATWPENLQESAAILRSNYSLD